MYEMSCLAGDSPSSVGDMCVHKESKCDQPLSDPDPQQEFAASSGDGDCDTSVDLAGSGDIGKWIIFF